MGGFRINGCGAKDYFKKEKFLGTRECPNCKKVASFYLEKAKFKASVLWIPTVTLKTRYAIMCEKCKVGNWIEDAEAYKLLGEGAPVTAVPVQQEAPKPAAPAATPAAPVQKNKVCPNCGAEVPGKFCTVCGANCAEPVAEPPKPTKKCPKCGAEVPGNFCTVCGTNMQENSSSGLKMSSKLNRN